MNLEELDKKILEQLKEDSRQSYRELAKKLGISHSNISKRVKQMEKAENHIILETIKLYGEYCNNHLFQ